MEDRACTNCDTQHPHLHAGPFRKFFPRAVPLPKPTDLQVSRSPRASRPERLSNFNRTSLNKGPACSHQKGEGRRGPHHGKGETGDRLAPVSLISCCLPHKEFPLLLGPVRSLIAGRRIVREQQWTPMVRGARCCGTDNAWVP